VISTSSRAGQAHAWRSQPLGCPHLCVPLRPDRPARGLQLQRQSVRHLSDHGLDDQVVWTGFHDYQIRDALTTTIRIALEVTAVSTIVGTAAAFPLVRSRLPFRSGIRIAMVLPIMIPGLLIA